MIDVATLKKSAVEEIRVALTRYAGRASVDIRSWVAYRTTGTIGPTKSGVRVPIEQLRELRAALDEAERAAVAEGMLDALDA